MSRSNTIFGAFVATLVVLLLACVLPVEKRAALKHTGVEMSHAK